MSSIARCALLLILSLSLGSAGFAAEKPQKPIDLISNLSKRMGDIAESTGSEKDQQKAIEQTRLALHGYVAAGGDPAALTAKSADGTTPLILAAYLGYPEIVTELLTDRTIVAAINGVDARGFSAWTYSNFAIGQSALLCKPDIMNNLLAWVPYLVNLPYYLAADESPYRKVRRALEQAGAHPDMAQVKRQWLDTCKTARDEVRTAVAQADDLLDVLAKTDPHLRDAIRARSN